MSKNKKPLTEAQREAKRIRDRKYRAAKKAAKVAKAKNTTVKRTEAKKIAKPVKTTLPKAHTAEVEPVRIHTIKPGDVIRFEGFTNECILDYANRLIMSVGFDRMTKMIKLVDEKQKACKSCKM